MRIGIDGRKISDFGIGTYIRGLLAGLAECRQDEESVVMAQASARDHIPAGFHHQIVDAPHYSFRELFVMGTAIERAAVDLFHAPHYVIPFTRTRMVVTIHDLIHLHMRHRNPLAPLYARGMLRRAVHKAARVLTVSDAVRREIETTFPGTPVIVTPNGADPIFRAGAPQKSASHSFLFVGNDKPHKNAGRAVEALTLVRRRHPATTLVLAGAPFERYRATEGVISAGFVKTEELASLYRNAIALLQPSVEEGFGLPALEAMASGTAVITSAHPALVEVTGDAALHVDARSTDDLAAAMQRVIEDSALRDELARRGIERAKQFTWKRCAELTRAAYLSAMM